MYIYNLYVCIILRVCIHLCTYMCVHTYVCASFSSSLKYLTRFLLLTPIDVLSSVLPLC